ncbi:MAG: DUF2726 domain-containing protein [Geobacter sp.]|nr:DUF2726 domain-containing protein [Geobacter sp.]
MNLFVVVVVVLVIVALVAALKAKQAPQADGLAFESKGPLFSAAERSFLGVLEQALDSRYRVFGKVRLGDLVKPARGLSNSKRTTAQNKIQQKHVDFVVCSAADLAVVGVVELDDQSHARADRAGRDDFVDQALAGAMIPVVHIPAKKGYAIQEVRAKLVEEFKLAADSPAPVATEEAPAPEQPEPPVTAHDSLPQPEEVAPVCPKCAAVMVKRQAKNGPHAGKWFWACSQFPTCRQVAPIENK